MPNGTDGPQISPDEITRQPGLSDDNASPVAHDGVVGLVHPQFRQHRLGEMLMMTGEEWAMEQGAASLELNVYDFDAAARGLCVESSAPTPEPQMLKWLD